MTMIHGTTAQARPGAATADPPEHHQPQIMVVGGGKGGVGKTCFSVNVAIEIARRGWRVVLLDADLGCSNVETVLGMKAPARLDDFFDLATTRALAAIVCDTAYENLRIIPGTTGLLEAANPRYQQRAALVRELRGIDADLVIVDLDAGAHLNTLDFFLLSATHGVIIITPERTSIDNAFKFLRGALYRRIERFYQSPEVGMLLKRSESLTGFVNGLYQSRHFGNGARDRIRSELVALARSMCPKILVNKANNAYEAQIAANIMGKHARRHLLVRPDNLGFLYFDRTVSESVNSGVPFVVGQPKRKVSGCISDIANRLGYF